MIDRKGRSYLEETKRIIKESRRNEILLRVIGGLAIRFHCHGKHSIHLRSYHDIDLFGLKKDYNGIISVFEQLQYLPNKKYNSLSGSERLQFFDNHHNIVDVFLDKFRMDQTLDFRNRLFLDPLTIPITDLLLTKLLIVRITNKDMRDIIAILDDHILGIIDESEVINTQYISDLCKNNWGLYFSVLTNIEKIIEFLEEGKIDSKDKVLFKKKLGIIRKSIMQQKKSFRWKLRSIIGTRLKWYNEVEHGEGEMQ